MDPMTSNFAEPTQSSVRFALDVCAQNKDVVGAMVDNIPFDLRLASLIPRDIASQQGFLPVVYAAGNLYVFVDHQKDFNSINRFLMKQLGLKSVPLPVHRDDLLDWVDKVYRLVDETRKTENRLGDLLLSRNVINRQQLAAALEAQKKTGEPLGRVLINQGYIDEETLYRVLAQQMNLPYTNLDSILEQRDPKITDSRVTVDFIKHNQIIPIKVVDGTLHVATTHRLDLLERDILLRHFDCRSVQVTICSEGTLGNFCRRIEGLARQSAGRRPSLGSVSRASESPLIDLDSVPTIEDISVEIDNEVIDVNQLQSDTTIPTIVNKLLYDAVQRNATDIHIERYKESVSVKYRIDGILREIPGTAVTLGNIARFIARLKIEAKLDVTERRRPQDGSFRKMFGKDRPVDFRIAFQPTIWGEACVIRVLDRSRNVPSLQELGFSEAVAERFLTIARSPQGLIVLTGPTGCGKTTTLYSTLTYLKSLNKKIITAEDPVEYYIEGIQQCQVNPVLDNTFAKFLRAFLRQNPDVILVGETRDSETAEIAARAAITGHLVLTTVHANSTTGVVTRLVDMGVSHGVISICLLAVLSQRLVRRVCPQCAVEYVPEEKTLRIFFELDKAVPPVKMLRGRGCEGCAYTGYRGRTVVYEFWELDEDLRRSIGKKVEEADLQEQALSKGLVPLAVNGIELALRGVTTLDDLLFVLPYHEIIRYKAEATRLLKAKLGATA